MGAEILKPKLETTEWTNSGQILFITWKVQVVNVAYVLRCIFREIAKILREFAEDFRKISRGPFDVRRSSNLEIYFKT